MEDRMILDLYFSRSEQAIARTDEKYGSYCFSIAHNILSSREDAQEAVSDTYLVAWNAIPPRRPAILATFLGKITRRLSIDRWRRAHAAKRGGGEVALALEELGDCACETGSPERELERKQLGKVFNRFLASLPETERRVFLRRYWYLDSVSGIAERFGFTPGKTATMLHRTRKKLRAVLEQEELL